MKRNFILLLVGSVALSVASDAQARPRPTPSPTPSGKVGRVIVQRAPNFGSDLFIRVSIDGKRVANIPRNQHYGGIVAAGTHILTVIELPKTECGRPHS